jgi:predicted AAA+ superfamily ATPase
MFKRDIEIALRNWSEKPNRKPLILRGARQVGKTTVVEQFSKEFDHFIKLNLDDDRQLSYFDPSFDIHKVLDTIFLEFKIPVEYGRLLLFIDEIQNSGQAIKMLRYFYEDASEIFVIAAGSLLETTLNNKISFPVGRVEYLKMHPCNFTEFLRSTLEERILESLQQIPFPAHLHLPLLDRFKLYSTIGGMPEVVAVYAKEKSVHSLSSIYDSLIVSFLDDVEKYARNETLTKVIRHTIRHAFLTAGSRIKFQGFGGSNYKNREIGEAFQMLQKAFILQLVYPSVNTNLPIDVNIRRSPKLQIMDTGLVTYFSQVQKEMLLAQTIDDTFQGRIAEHIVGQQIQNLSNSPLSELHFWTRERADADAEVDFIYQYDGKIFPIEVKSGPTGKLRSLFQFIDRAPHTYAVRVYSGKLVVEKGKTPSGKEFKLLNLPFYLIHMLPLYLDWLVSEH